jgi:mono/diheme cytochrome c family protein
MFTKARSPIFDSNSKEGHVMKRISAAFVVGAILAVAGLLVSVSAQNETTNKEHGVAPRSTTTPVSEATVREYPIPSSQGPSCLKHLGLTVSQTRMGQVGGTSALPADPHGNPQPPSGAPAGPANLNSVIQRFLSTFRSNPEQAAAILNEKFAVSGADLYRWNCQACHGPDGQGALPEINSVLGPVQGTSPAMTRKRMEARGIDADDDMIQQVTELAEASLRDRFQHGGKNMPSFEYLRADEVEALFGYLEKLASVPPTKRDGLLVPESAARAGEHIVRGTCHVCHDATGPGSGHTAMTQGTIPSLASFPRDQSLSGVVHQVQYGSSSTMKMTGGEVMPAFPYFTEEEIAALYLVAYSPRP